MVEIFRVQKAQIYYNTGKLTPEQVKQRLGCTRVFNAWLFDNNRRSKTYFRPCGWLVQDGKILFRDIYHDWGFSVNAGTPSMSTERRDGYISAFPLLKDGKVTVREADPAFARRSERTAVGWTRDGRMILWCDKQKMTIPEVRDTMVKYGAMDALLFDGGGSTQCVGPNGSVHSTRKVATMICIWDAPKEPEIDPEPEGEKPMVEINAYSLKQDGQKYITKNFKVCEFACQDGSDTIFIARLLPVVCQYIRTRVGKGIRINSAYRTPPHNAKKGGSPKSQHLYGCAADLKTPSGWTPDKLAAVAREIMPDWGGVGIYDWGIHVDVRDQKTDWRDV